MGKQPDRANTTLDDCFDAFKQTETLDEDNQWYCNKCKEMVCADKTLEIHRIPRIMVISLKRFRASKSRFGGSFGGFGAQKVDTLVEFPLTDLDMSKYILSEE